MKITDSEITGFQFSAVAPDGQMWDLVADVTWDRFDGVLSVDSLKVWQPPHNDVAAPDCFFDALRMEIAESEEVAEWKRENPYENPMDDSLEPRER